MLIRAKTVFEEDGGGREGKRREEKGRGGRREKDRQEWISEGTGVPRD